VGSLKLEVCHRLPELRPEAPLTGWVRVEHDDQCAVLLTPEIIDPERRYPLITVLHGAGRQDELLSKSYRNEAESRQALFLIPRSRHPTWDLIHEAQSAPTPGADARGTERTGSRQDLDFLEYAYDLIYRRYPIDAARQALIGYSDGASYALSVGISNPDLFRAVMAWAAGFVAVDAREVSENDPRPAVLLEYGTHDELFPFERVAVPMRRGLEQMGCPVTFRVDEGGRHWPSGDFQPDALDWFESLSEV